MLATQHPSLHIEISAEQHMPSDQHRVVMRRQLAALFKKYKTAETKKAVRS